MDGRSNRRPERGLEGQGRVGDLRHAYAVSHRDRKRYASEGVEIPAPACSAGEVRPTRRHADAAHRSLTRSFRRFSRILTTTEAHFWARTAAPGARSSRGSPLASASLPKFV